MRAPFVSGVHGPAADLRPCGMMGAVRFPRRLEVQCKHAGEAGLAKASGALFINASLTLPAQPRRGPASPASRHGGLGSGRSATDATVRVHGTERHTTATAISSALAGRGHRYKARGN